MIDTLRLWHQFVETGEAVLLGELLGEEVVFHSPVVHTPQRGKAVTTMYLSAALRVLHKDFRYLRQIVGPRDAALEFACEVDGIQVNGVDLVRWNDAGELVDFKVMIRPLKAINIVHQKMGELLKPQA